MSATRTAPLPPNSYLTLISTWKHLNALEQKWRALETESHVPATVFSSFDWTKTWCQIYATSERGPEIHILAGFADNKLVFLFPLMKHREFGLNFLSWLTKPIGQYGDILCAREQSVERWMSASLELLKRLKSVDVIHLRHVRQTSNLHNFAVEAMGDGKLHERAPYLDMTPFKTDADYDARYDARQRKHRKRSRKALEEFGPVEFKQLSDLASIDTAIDSAIEEKRKWLQSNGRFSRVMTCPKHVAFLKALARNRGKELGLNVTHITAGGRPISWEASFRYRGAHYCYMTAHDKALTDRSPGRLHFDYSQRHALGQGVKTYDLMVPHDPYKESWSSAMEPVNDYYLAMTMRGQLYGKVYLGLLRPELRKIYMRLPVLALCFLKKLLRS